MNNFTRKHPADYTHPYKNMQNDIDSEISIFVKIWKKRPNYILIHPDDFEELVYELQHSKRLPQGKVPDKFQYGGCRVVRSLDIAIGDFDFVGN